MLTSITLSLVFVGPPHSGVAFYSERLIYCGGKWALTNIHPATPEKMHTT